MKIFSLLVAKGINNYIVKSRNKNVYYLPGGKRERGVVGDKCSVVDQLIFDYLKEKGLIE